MKKNKVFLGIALAFSVSILFLVLFVSTIRMLDQDPVLIYASPRIGLYISSYSLTSYAGLSVRTGNSFFDTVIRVIFGYSTAKIAFGVLIIHCLLTLLSWVLLTIICYVISIKNKFLTIPSYILVFITIINIVSILFIFTAITDLGSLFTIGDQIETIIGYVKALQNGTSFAYDVVQGIFTSVFTILFNIFVLLVNAVLKITPLVFFVLFLLAIVFTFVKKKKKDVVIPEPVLEEGIELEKPEPLEPIDIQ